MCEGRCICWCAGGYTYYSVCRRVDVLVFVWEGRCNTRCVGGYTYYLVCGRVVSQGTW